MASEYFRSGADKVSIGSDAVFAAEEYLRTGVCDHFFQHLLPYFFPLLIFPCVPVGKERH